MIHYLITYYFCTSFLNSISKAILAKKPPTVSLRSAKHSKPTGKQATKNKLSIVNYQLSIIIALFAIVLYSNTLFNDYNLDDELVTKNHPLTSQGIKAIPKIFTSPYFTDKIGNAYEYRPVTLASFAIEHQFFKDNAAVSHFFNLIIYLCTCLLLFSVLSRLFLGNTPIPFIITLLFVAHPLHTEAVANIKSRDELLSLLGGIAALYFAIAFNDNKKIGSFLLLLISFTFGVLSKLSILPFAFIIPLALILFCETNCS